MPAKKRLFWKDVEWGSFFLATQQGQEPGAEEALGQLNSLMANYTNEGYEPITVHVSSEPIMLVMDEGQLTGVRVLVLWGRQDWK